MKVRLGFRGGGGGFDLNLNVSARTYRRYCLNYFALILIEGKLSAIWEGQRLDRNQGSTWLCMFSIIAPLREGTLDACGCEPGALRGGVALLEVQAASMVPRWLSPRLIRAAVIASLKFICVIPWIGTCRWFVISDYARCRIVRGSLLDWLSLGYTLIKQEWLLAALNTAHMPTVFGFFCT
jgi:hypothetical protein